MAHLFDLFASAQRLSYSIHCLMHPIAKRNRQWLNVALNKYERATLQRRIRIGPKNEMDEMDGCC